MNELTNDRDFGKDIRELFFRNVYYWKYYLISLIIFLTVAYSYTRYATYKYDITATLEIIDKAQDSEMALPTAMTVFNRSLINIENEMGVLKSYSLHERTVNSLKSYIKYYTIGNIKKTENHISQWVNDHDINFLFDDLKDYLGMSYIFQNINGKLVIEELKDEVPIKKYKFPNLSTKSKSHDLPFEIQLDQLNEGEKKSISILDKEPIILNFISSLSLKPYGTNSDQIILSVRNSNKLIGQDYINELMFQFDKDGIEDRKLGYRRTIEFVNTREKILRDELSIIESEKEQYKKTNEISSLEVATQSNMSLQNMYDSQLFELESQMDLILLLKNFILENPKNILPLEIGIDNATINELISNYNLILDERDKLLSSAGKNNYYLKTLEKKLQDIYISIETAIDNYEQSVNSSIANIKIKEEEFSDKYRSIPENEKILRSINRELEIKEALYLLLLQKKEEAQINLAVVKPSIKIIDYGKSSKFPVTPDKKIILLSSFLIGLLIPYSILYFYFKTDNKFHNKNDLQKSLNSSLPILGEIPLDKTNSNSFISENSRSHFAESLRILYSNLKLTKLLSENKKDSKNGKVILVTSSIKGEGKTTISVNLAKLLSNRSESKVLLVGTDLRNPQIHKFIGIDKNSSGLSNYIYQNDISFDDLIIRKDKLDIIISGPIPPNPSELIASENFEDFISKVKSIYDYVIIDTAPVMLVSDTLEISKFSDFNLFVVRANFTPDFVVDYLNKKCSDENTFRDSSIIFNGVGGKDSYGYNYAYKYSYGYGYNYGYGYGYNQDKK